MITTSRLLATAKALEDGADAATPGPWVVDEEQGTPWIVLGGQNEYLVHAMADHPGGRANADAALIAMWGPDTARAVAAWLRATAVAVKVGTWPPGGALSVADAVLGTERQP